MGLSIPVLLLGALIDELRRAERTTRQLAASLLGAQDQERRRIARDLHDSTGQNLIAGTLIAGRMQDMLPAAAAPLMRQLEDVLQQSIREVRTVSYLLHPPLLDEAGLGTGAALLRRGLCRAQRHRGRSRRCAGLRSAAARYRAGVVPPRAGSADQCLPPLQQSDRAHPADARAHGERDGCRADDRGRGPRACRTSGMRGLIGCEECDRHSGKGSDWPACASASIRSAAGSRSSSRVGHTSVKAIIPLHDQFAI